MRKRRKRRKNETKKLRERKRPPTPPPAHVKVVGRTSLPASLGGTADSASLGDAVLPSQNKHAALQYCWIFSRIESSSGNYFPAFPVVLMTLPRFSVFITCRTDIQEKRFLFRVYIAVALSIHNCRYGIQTNINHFSGKKKLANVILMIS
jgi:hypothetical protein